MHETDEFLLQKSLAPDIQMLQKRYDMEDELLAAVSRNYAILNKQSTSLDEIADIISYLFRSYCELMKKHSTSSYSDPITLTDYVNKSRVDFAKKLLKSTTLSIQDIAIQSGIRDIHYFTRLFRRQTGISPREFRHRGET